MMGLLGNIAFLNPWILGGLLLLPALWFLLRITPPSPKLIVFPATRFLEGLTPERVTAAKTPWWILLLRILIIALIVTALAEPVLNPVDAPRSKKDIHLVIDNSWPSAQTWDLQMQETQRLLDIASRSRSTVRIFTTAPEPGKDKPGHHGPMTVTQAEAVIKGLMPLPWPADYQALTSVIEDNAEEDAHSIWIGHGLREGDKNIFKTANINEYVQPADERLPLILRQKETFDRTLDVQVSMVASLKKALPVTVGVNGDGGRILDLQTVTLDADHNPVPIKFDLPDNLYNQARQIRIAGDKGAGGTLILDSNTKRMYVAIVTPSGDGDSTPLIDDSYYLERALAPYSNLNVATLSDILAGRDAEGNQTDNLPPVIIMPDIGTLPATQLNDLEQWVRDGGLLLRFAGPRMMDGQNFLTPVPLIKGGRALDGDMTWENPLQLTDIPDISPLSGIALPEEGLTIRRQLLAAPTTGLSEKSWANLEDGTPLITADRLEKGLIVMVHTAATPTWSDLPLSGFFVQMLRRVISLSGREGNLQTATGLLQPLAIMDGRGVLHQPDSSVRPIRAEEFNDIKISSIHPPGIYGTSYLQKILNVGDRIGTLQRFTDIPVTTQSRVYQMQAETNLMPYALLAAFILFLIDWLVMLAIQGRLSMGRALRYARRASAIVFVILAFGTPHAYAQNEDEGIRFAGSIHMAYVKSGDSTVDARARNGLTELAQTLRGRTSVEPSGVIGIDLETDELAFFPMIYWPLTSTPRPLSAKAQENLQYYLDHGGTILIDTRDRASSLANQGGRNSESLRIAMQGLNIPPLKRMPKDHVLTKTFYLLTDLHDALGHSTVWVEEQSATGRDGVSSVIIDNRDWAGIWSGMTGTTRQQELAQRFGVNLMLYALTGNYKSDQVHLPFILERLGQ